MTDLASPGVTCVICLESIRYQGSLSVCSHSFCFECILEWSKVDNSCPLCKSKFRCVRKVHLPSLQSILVHLVLILLIA